MHPKKYLSYSQLILIESSPKGYIDRYLKGKVLETESLSFGKKVAEAKERNKPSKDPEVEIARILLPDYPEREVEMFAETKHCQIFSKFDGLNRDIPKIGDHKTGYKEWTQERVNKDSQLTFYSYNYFLNENEIPLLGIDWFNRETQEVTSFETTRTMKDLLEIDLRIKKAWDKIERVCKEYGN